MKKLLFIAIIVFAGIISANAQYTVSTSWDPTTNWPTPLDQSTDGYGVWITIEDVTNDVVVVLDEGSGFLHNNVESHVFDVSGVMQPYIASLSGTAYFNIYCAVRAGNTGSLVVYDSGKSTATGFSSDEFINGPVSAGYVSF